MKPVLFYLLQVMVASAILYGYYHLALRNKKFHRYNRFYLLGAIVISVLIPFLNIPVYFTASETSSSPVLQTLTILSNSGGDIISPVSHQNINRSTWLTRENLIYAGYALIALLALLRILFSLRRIRMIATSNPVEKLNDIYFVNTAEPGTPFSFFRWLFWNNKIELGSVKGEQIFRHEIFHIRQKHSLDIIFLELLTVVFWINPFFHLIKKEIKAIHEFLADKFAVNEDQKWDYAELLLMQALNTQQHLVNPFFHNQIKRRIAMITSSSKPGHQYLRKLMVLPIAAIVAILFAFSYKTREDKASPLLRLPNDFALNEIIDTIPPAKQETKYFKPPIITKVMPGEKLVVIDGQIRGVTRNLDADQPWAGIDRNEIESISVLKDASATARYGKLGEYGVIEITTKKYNIEKKDTIPQVIEKSIYYDGGDKIILQADSIIWKTLPNKTKINTKSALLIVNGKKTSNDIFSEKTIISKRMIIYSPNDPEAVKRYGEGAKNGVIVMEEARSVDIPTREYYKTELIPADISEDPNPGNKIFEKVEIEPKFPGGEEKWKKYLGIYLNEHIPAYTGCPPGEYTVVVQFIVNLDGTLSNINALTNHGYGMEKNAINLISNGPRWEPAIQNGHKVVAYKKQPITYVIRNEKVRILSNPVNTLYIGIENPLTIASSEVKPEDLVVSISQGDISGSNGKYNARVNFVGPVDIKVSSKSGKVLGQQTFQATTIVKPQRPEITVEKLRKSSVYDLLKVDPGTEIISYSLAIDLDNGGVGEESNTGSQFSPETKKLIEYANVGKTITIDNIKIMKDGKEKKVPSKVYYVVN